MDHSSHSRRAWMIEELLTIAIAIAVVLMGLRNLTIQAVQYASDMIGDYHMVIAGYVDTFQVMELELIEKVKEDLTLEEMNQWLQSMDDVYRQAIGSDVYDGISMTYKGGYAHSWNYGDYTNFDPDTRIWYQRAKEARGEVTVVAPYVTYLDPDYLSNDEYILMTIARRYSSEVTFDYDLKISGIEKLLTKRVVAYPGTRLMLYDTDGNIFSCSDETYFSHNAFVPDDVITEDFADKLTKLQKYPNQLKLISLNGVQYFGYQQTTESGLSIFIGLPYLKLLVREFLVTGLITLTLILFEIWMYLRNRKALQKISHETDEERQYFTNRIEELTAALEQRGADVAKGKKDGPAWAENQDAGSSYDDSEFDLTQLVHSLTTVFYSQARNKDVRFAVSIEDLTAEWLKGDALGVNQILLNLLSNAVQSTSPKGLIALNLRQIGELDQNVQIQFQVTDTGDGMSEEYLNHVFHPFEQRDGIPAKDYDSTGLGLSICHHLVQKMGGQIEVHSEPGKGTTFIVTLNFEKAQDPERKHLPTDSFTKIRALVVDDEESSCEYIRKLLERCGVKCDAVTSARRAIRRIRSRQESYYPYDLCIVNWNMEEMGGLEITRQIHEICGDRVPTIVATSYDDSSVTEEAKTVGVNQIISKPLFQSTLFDMLVNTFGKYEPRMPKNKLHVDFKGIRVLLAEDHPLNMEIAVNILMKAGLEVTQAKNGKEALELFTASAPETFRAILMDIQMPELDGYEAAVGIRTSGHPQAASIPIIAMTANAFTSDVTKALAAGMNDHISKPVSCERLFEVLTRLVKDEQ